MVAVAVQVRLGVLVVPVLADAAAECSALAVLASGDRVEALLDVGDDRDQAGQGLARPIALPTDVNVDPAARVDPVAFGFERSQDLGHLGEPFFAFEDRAYDLALVAAVAVVDRAVRFGRPTRGQVRHLDSVLVGSDPQAVVADGGVGGDRLDLNPEGQVVGVHRLVSLFGWLSYPS